jgi:hypothetical protein
MKRQKDVKNVFASRSKGQKRTVKEKGSGNGSPGGLVLQVVEREARKEAELFIQIRLACGANTREISQIWAYPCGKRCRERGHISIKAWMLSFDDEIVRNV